MICFNHSSPSFLFKVRDHCHLTGKFRGAAHQTCNLQYRINAQTIRVPVIIHNLKNYDAHIILQSVKPHHGKISCIPMNSEKYISFTIGDVTFLDSCQFMMSSLDSLVKNLTALPEVEKFLQVQVTEEAATTLQNRDYRDDPFISPILNDTQQRELEKRKELMNRKGVYPYSYFDSLERFRETVLPPKDAFFNKLTDTPISDADYRHAEEIFTTLNMESLKEFHDFYLISDVLLLSDVFEAFRDVCMDNYKLDPCHFFTAPGLSWEAALKMTKIELELMTDYEMHLFMEEGIRGGVSTITHRYAEANNHYMDNFDETKPETYLIYWDANNLYGYAMSKKLPTSNFRWLSEEEIENLKIENLDKDASEGFIFEVDLGKSLQLFKIISITII